jgi:hypothetical protein
MTLLRILILVSVVTLSVLASWRLRDAMGYEIPLVDAARSGEWRQVHELLNRGADPNETSDLQNFHTALYWALANDQDEIAKELLEHNVVVSSWDVDGVATPEWKRRHRPLWSLLQQRRSGFRRL